MKLKLHWIIIIACALIILVAGFVFFRNDNPVVTEQSRSETVQLDVTSQQGGRHPASVQAQEPDATLGEILPYLATPKGR